MNKMTLLLGLLIASSVGCGGTDIHRLEDEKNEKQRENARLTAEHEGLRAEWERLRAESAQNAQGFEDDKKTWADARQSLVDKNEELQRKLDEKHNLQIEHNKWSKANQALDDEVRRLKIALEEEALKRETQIGEVAESKVNLQADFNRAQNELQELETANQELKTEVSQLRDKLLFAQSGSSESTTINQQLNEEIIQLRTQNEKLEVQNSALKTSIDDSNLQLLALKTKSDEQTLALSEQKQSLETENASLQQQLLSDKVRLESSVKALLDSNLVLSNNVRGLQESLQAEKQRNGEENARLDALNKEVNESLEKLKGLRDSEIAENTTYRNTSVAMIDDLKKNVKALEAEKQILTDANAVLEASIEKLKTESRRLESEKKKQKAEYDSLAAAKQSLEIDHEALQQQLESERAALKTKTNELLSAKRDLNKKILDLDGLLAGEREKGSLKDDFLADLEEKLAQEKRNSQEALKAVEEKERQRARIDSSSVSADELHKQIQELKTTNHDLKLANEGTVLTLEKLQDEISKLNDPHEIFKRESQEFIATLRPRQLFDGFSKNQFETFKDEVKILARKERLLDSPEQDEKRFKLPLPLVFEQAPKPKHEFTVYVASPIDDWDELERTAQFILATDDEKQLQALLEQNGKGPMEYREFKVQVDFPIICLGPDVFMLPKALLNPLFENEMTKIIELNYKFGEGLHEPLEYRNYIEKKITMAERVEGNKNKAVTH